MTFNAMTEHYEEITVCGKPALFTSIRIKRDTVPDGLYAYDVRHDDECRGIPCEIAPFVMVNHWGTIILAEPLELPDDGRRYIDEDTDWNYAPLDGEDTANHKPCTTISDFMTAYGFVPKTQASMNLPMLTVVIRIIKHFWIPCKAVKNIRCI